MNLDWLINSTELNNFKCVAGKSNLNNKILSVNVLDNPDVIRWIKKDELVLTTGYIFKDDTEAQINIIRELKETGCSALAIKIKRFFETIPSIMIEEAEKVGLPLIEVPFYYSFSEISKTIYNAIYSQEFNENLLQYNIINTLSSIFFENKGIDVMINELSHFISKSIILMDCEYNVISASFTPEYEHLVNGIDLPKVSSVGTASYISHTEISDTAYTNLKINYEIFRFYIITLPNFTGMLCILIDDTELTSPHKMLLEKVKSIISLEITRSDKIKTISNSYHNFFFDFLISENKKSEKEILEICNFYDFDYTKKRVCASFILENCENDQHRNKIISTLQKAISNTFRDHQNLFLCANNNILSLFLFYKLEQSNIEAVNNTYNIVYDFYNKLGDSISCTLHIGISRCHSGITSIRTAFRDTLNCINLKKHQNINEPICCYSNKHEYHLLSEMSEASLMKLCEDTIMPIIEFDKDNNTNLINTLKVYYLSKFNCTDTAKKLFLHRNTLINRLDKIKELLHGDFSDNDKMFSVYLGICAYEILKH
ncbi:purine catabolism regulatory protein [Clostridium polyendosporum]|uniref:Purine catabolism regulatory protein n=1 Tax=Clostridium polyendosporum TaxID=69208 RepID=A0A919VHF6_9CLOT|nr:PucR family transcriptional regulator [Clostridium polyendosporum]GIM30345.1 purine catabolism regulatory protein [Clostridium polyendosporum]